MEIAQLEEAVKRAADAQMSRSSQFTTRETVNMRVIESVMRILDFDVLTLIKTKDQIKIDTSVSIVIENLWKKGKICSTAINKVSKSDFDSVMEKFLSRDYIYQSDLSKFCQTIQKAKITDEARRKLWILFAMDGLYGLEYRNYMKFLAVKLQFGDKPGNISRDDIIDPMYEEEGVGITHVRAIRSIYRYLNDVTPQVVCQVMKNVHGIDNVPETKDTNVQDKGIVSETKDTMYSGDEDDDDSNEKKMLHYKCVENYYRKMVGKKLSSISTWLKSEIEKTIKLNEAKKKRNEAIIKAHKERKEKGDTVEKKKRTSDDASVEPVIKKKKRVSDEKQ